MIMKLKIRGRTTKNCENGRGERATSKTQAIQDCAVENVRLESEIKVTGKFTMKLLLSAHSL